MKSLIYFTAILLVILSCGTSNKNIATTAGANDTVRIANDSLQYEVIIIDGGFNTWMATNARPREHYTQNYLEMRNVFWVNEWNTRAMSGDPGMRELFEMPIDYRSTIDYGFEVNYMLFNYLTYFQLKNNIRLGGFVPRI